MVARYASVDVPDRHRQWASARYHCLCGGDDKDDDATWVASFRGSASSEHPGSFRCMVQEV